MSWAATKANKKVVAYETAEPREPARSQPAVTPKGNSRRLAALNSPPSCSTSWLHGGEDLGGMENEPSRVAAVGEAAGAIPVLRRASEWRDGLARWSGASSKGPHAISSGGWPSFVRW